MESPKAKVSVNVLVWLVPFLILCVGVGWWALRGKPKVKPDISPSGHRAPVKFKPPAAPPLAPGMKAMTLPGGKVIQVRPQGLEVALLKAAKAVPAPNDKSPRFNFDRVEYEPDSPALKPSAQAQMENVAMIMHAYPALKIEIYAFVEGRANQSLAQARADTARKVLSDMGVSAGRIAAHGLTKGPHDGGGALQLHVAQKQK